MYRTYSDISIRKKRVGYAFIVIDSDFEVVKQTGRLSLSTATEAEISAMILALRLIPDDSRGTAYTDLIALEHLLVGKGSYAKKMVRPLAILRDELYRTNMSVVFNSKNNRSKFYHWCHYESRKAALVDSEEMFV